MTMGVLRLPNSGSFHLSVGPSGSSESESPVSREMPLYAGPRQTGQSSGSAEAALALVATFAWTLGAVGSCAEAYAPDRTTERIAPQRAACRAPASIECVLIMASRWW